jgi:uncharacterized protein YndB with AHSA1/START domain
MTKPNDRVERETFMKASIERSFAALTDPSLFPTWGPERVEGKIAVGERPMFDFGFSGKCVVYIVAVDSPRYFAYRWKQGEHDPAKLLGDPLAGPNTLVEFFLEEKAGGTRVRVVESGIADLPVTPGMEPAMALEHMGKGWELMLGGLPRHLTFVDGDVVETKLEASAPVARVRELLGEPSKWWFGMPALDIVPVDDTHVRYRWNDKDVDFAVEPTSTGSRVSLRHAGFSSPFEAKKAHQMWGVILGMLEMALAT